MILVDIIWRAITNYCDLYTPDRALTLLVTLEIKIMNGATIPNSLQLYKN